MEDQGNSPNSVNEQIKKTLQVESVGDNCKGFSFDAGVFSVKGKFCIDGTVIYDVYVAGIKVDHGSANLRSGSYCNGFNAGVLEGKFCLELRGTCLYTTGKVGNWILGYKHWNAKIVCFPGQDLELVAAEPLEAFDDSLGLSMNIHEEIEIVNGYGIKRFSQLSPFGGTATVSLRISSPDSGSWKAKGVLNGKTVFDGANIKKGEPIEAKGQIKGFSKNSGYIEVWWSEAENTKLIVDGKGSF